MAIYKAIVKVEYQFEFECDLSSRREIQEEAEKQWEMLSGCGSEFDDVKFKIVVNGRVIDLPSEVNDKIYEAIENIIDSKLDDVMYAKQ